ncbi:MAG: hypothetical protein E5V92_12585 [Mesorhizobium sp.]|uniref:hypothetical protein n=1 Tax=unclassified Mesorhizobium TaxID=325217 RepID=UPI000F7609DB|nr:MULTISPECIES: hypothetical protein [unclassified Mesorhizobium]AZO74596.1 hypothetical protein EJ067_28155 [Mesorhizobium sp. M1D.F.Ca.ET.043.01.1.1]RWA96534.1 MAG: hypothetical protein EOQ32_02710 [Mesorhizobium sp.]RWE12415.1 MAG: hypothetical protein EOS61_15025 [Mesorhizobium sp.]TJW86754.1 MAG: hypothetical protein E5V92_12585 [Mesorhizobium sp.]
MRVAFAMKKVVISLFALLAGTSFAMAAGAGCDAFKWPVTREQALFPAAPAAQSGADLTVGQAMDFALVAVDTISFEVPPARAPAAGTFGATASVIVPPEGELQLSLSDEAWIDVVQNGRAVKSTGFSGVKTCPGIRKSVRFKLAGGAAIIQLSGAKKADLKVAVLTPE